MKTPRSVLMICYYFPPILATGTNRSLAFAKLLPLHGWKPVVLTVEKPQEPWERLGTTIPDDIEIHRTTELNFARILDFTHGCLSRIFRIFGRSLRRNWLRELLAIPDTQISWWTTIPALRLSKRCDVIYASCSPFSSAVSAAIASLLSKKPLVLDFRDAWTLNPHIQRSVYHQTVISFFENLVLKKACRLIVNTEGTKRLYLRRYPALENRISVIPNGYDSLTPVTRADKPTRLFSVMHIGSFYGNRNPDNLLEAMTQLPHLPLEFIQVGGSFPAYDRYKDRIRITVHQPMAREKALELFKEASLLYLKQGFEPGVQDYIAVAAKTYEYLATGLPILADLPEGDNAEVVRQYTSCAYVVCSDSVLDIRNALEKAYEERLTAPHGISPAFKEDFERSRLTAHLAGLLEEVSHSI